MGFSIERRARSRKRGGWFRRVPDPREVGERLARLVRRMFVDGVVRTGRTPDRFAVELRVHAAAPPVALELGADGELVCREAGELGPGYHAEVAARLAPLLDELDYAWTEPFDLAATRAAMCAWLAGELARDGQVRIGVPQARRFRIEAPVLTPLGPRDAAWLAAVRADPMHAADAFPWWESGPGRAALARALVAMWIDVPWREPLDADERDLMHAVDDALRAARDADPALELPWPEWKSLLLHLGIADEDVDARAGDRAPAIGYRRYPLEVELSGGWRVCLPGAMVGHWEDEGARFWATDGDRVVEFTSFTAEGETDSDRLLAVAPEHHAIVDRIAEAARRGRAEAFDDDGVRVVVGLVACAPHVGILTCKGGDQVWALATWRTLEHEP